MHPAYPKLLEKTSLISNFLSLKVWDLNLSFGMLIDRCGVYTSISRSAVWPLTSNNERLHTVSRKQTLPDLEGQFNSIHEAYIAAIAHVRAARLTDVELIYTPSQIALACWHLVSPGLAEQWARAKFEPDVISILPEIAQMILGDGKPPDVERVREIDKRLRICKNPEKVPGTKA